MLSFSVAFLSVAVATYDDFNKTSDSDDESAFESIIMIGESRELTEEDKDGNLENSYTDDTSMLLIGLVKETAYIFDISQNLPMCR